MKILKERQESREQVESMARDQKDQKGELITHTVALRNQIPRSGSRGRHEEEERRQNDRETTRT